METRRRLTFLPLAPVSPPGKAPIFGDDFGGEVEREAALGLTLEMARVAESRSGWSVSVLDEGDIARILGADARALSALFDPARAAQEPAEPAILLSVIERLAGGEGLLAAGSVGLRPGAVWRLWIFDVAAGRAARRESLRFSEDTAAAALERMLNAPAATLDAIDAAEAGGRPEAPRRREKLPTRSPEAYLNYCAGLGVASRIEAQTPANPRLGCQRFLAALGADAEFSAASEALGRLAEECLAIPGAPREAAREGLDQAIAGGYSTPLLLRLRGMVDFEREEHRRAMVWFRRALAEGDRAETCSYYLAKCAEALRDWEEMAGWTAKLKRAQPRDAASHLIDGVAAMRNNRPEDAIASWREALTLDPELSEARANIALALLESGRIEAAMVEIERELQRGCPNWDFAHVAALVLAESGDKERAKSLVEEFLRTRDLSASGLVEAARVLGKLEEFAAACEVLEEAMMLAPCTDAADSASRYLCELAEPGFEKAFQRVAEAVVNRDPKADFPRLEAWTEKFSYCWHLWYVRAVALWQDGQVDLARSCLERARRLRPGHPEILCKLSSLLLELGYFPEARERAAEALAAAPGHAAIHSQCALAAAYDRDFREALRHLRESQRIDPTDPLAALVAPLIRKLRARPDFPLPRRGRLPARLLREPSERRDLQGIAESQIVRREHRRAEGPRRLSSETLPAGAIPEGWATPSSSEPAPLPSAAAPAPVSPPPATFPAAPPALAAAPTPALEISIAGSLPRSRWRAAWGSILACLRRVWGRQEPR
jgi:tetratricopeptide (TPR) repeat protein